MDVEDTSATTSTVDTAPTEQQRCCICNKKVYRGEECFLRTPMLFFDASCSDCYPLFKDLSECVKQWEASTKSTRELLQKMWTSRVAAVRG